MQNRALRQIKDPLSRLVASGALFRAGRLSPDGIGLSGHRIRTSLAASAAGVSQRAGEAAEAAGDRVALEAIRKRIELTYQRP